MEDPRPAQKVRVMVASSDISVRKLVCSALIRDRRFQVAAQATDGDAVVACSVEFDAAIVDVSIAGLGILGVMSGLRRRVSGSVVVAVSRTDAIYLRHACMAEGADDYLVLPDDLDKLPGTVVEAVHTGESASDRQPVQA